MAHQISDAPRKDGFDDWCQVRDKREDNSVSAKYVAPGVVGAGDLDEYGAWRQTPEYGPVWVPTAVTPGCAPYSSGQWIWQNPWGWTWVDDAPWGFAPFHYGRWVSFGGYWGWAPGPYYARPYYAPALVAWFGGPGFGIGFGFGGGFGWCPLGWGEPFFPWYHGSRGYFRNVNISNTHITNINNITNNYYNNRNGAGLYGRNGIGMPRYANTHGFTAVSRNTLERGLPVAANAARTSPSALRNLSSASISRPNVSPTRENMLGPKAGLPAARPSAGVASRPTVSRMTPPASSARPSTMQTAPAHNTATQASSRVPEGPSTSARSMPAPAGRYVPRPPQSLGSSASMSNHGVSSPATGCSRNISCNSRPKQRSTTTYRARRRAGHDRCRNLRDRCNREDWRNAFDFADAIRASPAYDDERAQHRSECVSEPFVLNPVLRTRYAQQRAASHGTNRTSAAQLFRTAEPRKLLGPLVQRQRVRQLWSRI